MNGGKARTKDDTVLWWTTLFGLGSKNTTFLSRQHKFTHGSQFNNYCYKPSRVQKEQRIMTKELQQIKKLSGFTDVLKMYLTWYVFDLIIQPDNSFTNLHITTYAIESLQHANVLLAWNSWYHSILCARTSIALSMSSSWLYIVTNADTYYLNDSIKKLMTARRQVYDINWHRYDIGLWHMKKY